MSSIQTINPATAEICGEYPLMTKTELNRIIESVHKAQLNWCRSEIVQRQAALRHLGQILLKNKPSLATLISTEMGKPISQSLGEVEKCASLCDYYSTMGPAFLEPETIKTEFTKSYRSIEPLGIIFAIMPWNFPIWQVMRFAIPNLMLGNGALLKHAPNTTGTSLAIESLFTQAGFPENLFRSIVMDVSFAPHVIKHPLISGVTLTGSARAGQSVAKTAGAALKKVVLELGGSDPYIILDDADLDLAAEQCVLSRLNNAGQVCIAAKRIIVTPKIKANFEAAVLEKVKQYKIGNPLDIHTTLGPLARDDLRATLHNQVQRSIAGGAHCLLGGEMPKDKGYYYPATVLTHINSRSPASKEELFGPVVALIQAKNENDALKIANTTSFGLAGAIFTRDLEKGERLAKTHLQAGVCAVNTLVASDPRLPFGGIKQSGFGRELSLEGMREFANIKTVIINA